MKLFSEWLQIREAALTGISPGGPEMRNFGVVTKGQIAPPPLSDLDGIIKRCNNCGNRWSVPANIKTDLCPMCGSWNIREEDEQNTHLD